MHLSCQSPHAARRQYGRRGFLALVGLAVLSSLIVPAGPAPAAGASSAPRPARSGYWTVASDGGIFAFGDAQFFGSTGAVRLNKPIVGMAATPSGKGYWLTASDGGIFAFGDAEFFGSTGAVRLNKPIVGMAATPSGKGYWLTASDGGIFAFGDAEFFGSTGAINLNKPIVAMASTPTGRGYWLTASDGGMFAFGDAEFFGSTGGVPLNRPIVGMAAMPSGKGYWLTASDGGIFAFGESAFHGAATARTVRKQSPSVVGLLPSPTGVGYWQVAAEGDVFAFGDAADLGGVSGLNRPLVAMAVLPLPVPDLPVIGAGPGADPDPGGDGGNGSSETTTTTEPPLVALPPRTFSGEFEPSWGTSPSEDPEEAGRNKAGRVLAVAEAGNTVFVAGEFAGVTPPGVGTQAASADPTTILRRPYLVALNARTGELLDWDAQPNDSVLSLAVSPDGRRLYVGGRFRSIGGGPAGRIAALDTATGRLDPTFQAPLADSGVRAMTLVGNTLYVGGTFNSIGDVARPGLAALDATTGALRTDFVPPANTGGRYKGQTGIPTEDGNHGIVLDLAVTDDGRLIVGGDFLHFGDQGGLLVLDAHTGAKTAWQPEIGRPVHGLTVWPGDGTTFFAAAGGPGGVADAYRPDGPTKYLWRHRVDGDAMDVVATTKRVYLVGHYDYVLGKNTVCTTPPCTGGKEGDVANRHISAFDAVSGAHDVDYVPQLNTPQGPYVAFIGARHLYVGGDFTEVNGRPQPGFVKFPATN